MSAKLFYPGENVFVVGIGFNILICKVRAVTMDQKGEKVLYYDIETPKGTVPRMEPEEVFSSLLSVRKYVAEKMKRL